MRPGIALDALFLAHHAAVQLHEGLYMADRFGDVESQREGMSLLSDVLRDTREIIETKKLSGLSGSKRLPQPPYGWTPQQLIDELRIAVEIETIAFDVLLRDRPGVPYEEERRLLQLARALAKALGIRARTVRREVKKRAPKLWTKELEEEFKKVLRLGK